MRCIFPFSYVSHVWPSDPLTNSKFTSVRLAWCLSSSKEAQSWTMCSLSGRQMDQQIVDWRQELRPHLWLVNSKPLRTSVEHCCHGNRGGKHLARGSLPKPTVATARDEEGISGRVREQLETKGPDLSQPA